MKRYIKDGIIKHRNQIVIRKDGRQYINPTEEMILADGWVEHVAPTIETPIDNEEGDYLLQSTIEHPVPEVSDKAAYVRARHKLRNTIGKYDTSKEVNIFYMQGMPIWLDKATRAGLMLRFQAEQAMGKETTSLWYGSEMFSLPLATAMQMLLAIEIYASECYDNTQRHLAEINKLATKEEIEAYDYRSGYPDKLEF